MHLEVAIFENFRNIDNFPFSFSPGMNIIYGGNAQGKTNVIEGIYIFAGGKSFRRAREKDTIKFDKNFSQISISYADEKRENKMSVKYFREMKKECFINGVKTRKMSDFIGNFKAVLFCPEHLAIVKDEPSVRRAFIDSAISQIKPAYLGTLIEYEKILEQKNALLKNAEEYSESSFDKTYEVLSERLAGDAAYITEVRQKYLSVLFGHVRNFLSDMTDGKETVTCEYISNLSTNNGISGEREENSKRYFEMIMAGKEREKGAKTSIFGSHRDDFDIRLDGNSAKIFASQGQQRSIALALKLAEGEICREETDEYPVFLFDDVLSELDRNRKNYILSRLDGKQVIVTSCDEADFSDCVGATKIYVENGKYFYR